MGFASLVRSMVKVADGLTKDLQSKVWYERYLTSDRYGKKLFAAKVLIDAAVDWKQHQVRTMAGELTTSRTHLTFTNIEQLRIATGGDGIDDNDKFTLMDGTTGPILDMSGYLDPGTAQPFATEVWLG